MNFRFFNAWEHLEYVKVEAVEDLVNATHLEMSANVSVPHRT